jgi:hypothetical protein
MIGHIQAVSNISLLSFLALCSELVVKLAFQPASNDGKKWKQLVPR